MKNYKKPEIEISKIETQPIASAGLAQWAEMGYTEDVITVYTLEVVS